MKTIRGLCLTLAGLMLLTSQAFAADYNFETPAPSDYYGSTSYEEVYGAQYNYGGTGPRFRPKSPPTRFSPQSTAGPTRPEMWRFSSTTQPSVICS